MKIIFTAAFLLSASFTVFTQPMIVRLKFEQGQTVNITQQIKSHITQQAGGQVIDFTIDATGDHSYRVTNTTADNNTLHHRFQRIHFAFDGWGRKMNFDSKNETDLNGMFGPPVREILGKTYDIIIDTNGKVLMAIPVKIPLPETNDRMAIVHNLLKDIYALAQPPEKGSSSLFKVLPGGAAIYKGQSWDTYDSTADGKFVANYRLSDITDSTIIVEFNAASFTVSKLEMMGNETTTKMNHASIGQIVLDKATGILKERSETIQSNGTTESSFGTLPVTSKTLIAITVNQVSKQ